MSEDAPAWLRRLFAGVALDPALATRALTHASVGEANYERLEFLGDRVLGLAMAEWLYELFPDEPEGILSRRINSLVSGATCAAVGRAIGLSPHIRLAKGAHGSLADSDHVLGDIIESLLGAVYLTGGFEPARAWVRRHWAERVRGEDSVRQHPKAALQDWALARNLGLPVYAEVSESGPDHLPEHTVAVRVGVDTASATASTKREAETGAARALLATLEA
ncbi:ribonuclease III, partial [Sphingomonas bacterium]|uniref:ribonuclease III n=1 Tax=Sphingomonas bacterium TaxID=1895847 RepID=UPI0020C6755F